MQLRRIRLENYGPLVEAELPLDAHFNVIVGVNGAGKSSVLHAVAQMLGRYVSSLRTGRATGSLPNGVIRKGASFTRVTLEAETDGPPVQWVGVKRRTGHTGVASESGELARWTRVLSEQIEQNPSRASLPLVVLYSVNRAVLDIPLRIRTRVAYQQFGAFEGALSETSSNFRTFFAWFRDREDVENETRVETKGHRDPQLNAVRQAVEGLMPGFKDLRVRRQPLRMLITKRGLDLRVDQLSDGEKCMLALAGDLARRLALANPGAKKPLEGRGVVLIDELELHLHPGWQRRTVAALRETFPNCQFIVSTHSPQVVSEVPHQGVFLLKGGRVERALKTLGLESGRILEELMEEPSRPGWAKKDIEAIYEAIDDEDYDDARQQLKTVADTLGSDDPALTAAVAVLRSKRPPSE